MRRKPAPKPGKRDARRRQEERLFQLGEFWLGYEAGSDFVFYYWYDDAARRTRRRTTGLRDLDEAKLWLAKLVLAEPPNEPQHPDVVTIASARRFYFQHHVNATRAGKDVVRDKVSPRRAFALLIVYMNRRLKDEDIEGAPKVGDFSLAAQYGFMRWCAEKQSLSCKTISTYLALIKACFRFAAKPLLITDVRGREREARVLSTAPFVEAGEKKVSEITGLPKSKPRDWIPTDAELAATLSALRREDDRARNEALEASFRYAILALNTAARPEAITELSVAAQVRFDTGLIYLNPDGRVQTNKVRPSIRLTDNLRSWLIYWNLDRPIMSRGQPVIEISSRTLKQAAKRAKVTDWRKFTRYTFRHYIATRVRRVAGVTVEREDRASWLGHKDPDHRTTEEWYESLDADYLDTVRRAIDAIMTSLQLLTKTPLFAPGAVQGTRLTVVQKAAPDEGRKTGEDSA